MSWIQSAFGSRVSPVILFIIVLLAVVFFVAGLLHLLIRFLLKQRSRLQHLNNHTDHSTSGAFQRQLQQLFHLHDSGLDQAHIDALPVFSYRDLVGSKEPFDCAVCLCEFSEVDKLRLLPLCSHAFHIDCIDTWLLSNSTCPLCRGMILSPGVPFENPVFYFDDSKETEDVSTSNDGFLGENNSSAVITEKRVFSVRLGKFKNVINSSAQRHHQNEQISEAGETSSSNLDARRCYSMGSFQYVVADSDLQVALCPSRRERRVKGRGGGGGGGVSRNFAADEEDGVNGGDVIGKRINGGAKGESFSVSKIWLWSKKGTSRYSDEV